jgi:hypothetical protein
VLKHLLKVVHVRLSGKIFETFSILYESSKGILNDGRNINQTNLLKCTEKL